MIYYFLVYGYDLAMGNFVFNVSGVPVVVANDVCPGTSISSLPFTDSGDTGCAATNYSLSCVSTTSHDVMYNLTLPSCQTVTVSTCGSGFDTAIEDSQGRCLSGHDAGDL